MLTTRYLGKSLLRTWDVTKPSLGAFTIYFRTINVELNDQNLKSEDNHPWHKTQTTSGDSEMYITTCFCDHGSIKKHSYRITLHKREERGDKKMFCNGILWMKANRAATAVLLRFYLQQALQHQRCSFNLRKRLEKILRTFKGDIVLKNQIDCWMEKATLLFN